MHKLIAVLAAPASSEPAAFQRRLLDGLPRRLAASPAPLRCVLNLVDVPAPAGKSSTATPYAAVIELWFETFEFNDGWDGFAGWRMGTDGFPSAAAAHVYHVKEVVQLDDAEPRPLGRRAAGVKAIYLVRRHAALSDAEARQRWREHAPLARTHHAGMLRYVQNGVITALTPGAPLIHGIAELRFPTYDDFERRMFDSAAGRAAIAADAGGLVAEAVPLFCGEYVLR